MAIPNIMELYTSNPIHDYEFSWTIEHFSFSPDVLRGPSVAPISGFKENLSLELQYKPICDRGCNRFTLNVALIDLNVKDSGLVVSGCTTIRNTDDKIFKSNTISNAKFKGRIYLLSYTSTGKLHVTKLDAPQIMNLLDDKLVVKGKLSFSGYHITTKIFSSLKDRYEASGEVLKEDLKTLYESGVSSEVVFSVGEKTLRAHKAILLTRSPVFAKMFDNDMLERNSNTVVINDSDFDAFNCFLLFLYTGIMEEKILDRVRSLYYLAHKYQVKSLHSICSGILSNSLSIDSVCSVLILSDLHGDEELNDVAKAFIRSRLSQIAVTTEWAEMVLNKPQLVKDIMHSKASETPVE